jgi:A/G-specific adenine glycosylase
MARFPDVQTLAAASMDDVYALWQGLGYYSRARSLHATAGEVTEKFDGKFPADRTVLLKLKGIGPYTAAAVMALGFNRPETIVDGNVIRVIARLYGLADPVDRMMPVIRTHAQSLTSQKRPADYASAIMDLGATVCTPRKPDCGACPFNKACVARARNLTDQIPFLPKLVKKEKHANVYLIQNDRGEIFIRNRPGRKLLSGLYEFPWDENLGLDFSDTGTVVTHVFTHFKAIMSVCVAHADRMDIPGLFVPIAEFENYPSSTLMKKVLSAAMKDLWIGGAVKE